MKGSKQGVKGSEGSKQEAKGANRERRERMHFYTRF